MVRSVTTTRRVALGTALAGMALVERGSAAIETRVVRISLTFAGHVLTASLLDNPSARDLATLLPLDLELADYSTNEKIAYLPRKLTEDGAGPFSGEAPGDVCYYAPWGNLAFFHAGYRWSKGLIRLGRLDSDIEPLLTRGTFALRIERLG